LLYTHFIIIIIHPCASRTPKWSFIFRFWDQNSVCIVSLYCAFYTSCQSLCPWFSFF